MIDARFAEDFPNIVEDIRAMMIADNATDSRVWTKHSTGKVTSRASYDLCRVVFPRVNWGSWIWANHIPPTRFTLVWKLIWAKTPSWDVLNAYGIQGPSICVFCKRNIESMDHIFISCDFPSCIHADC